MCIRDSHLSVPATPLLPPVLPCDMISCNLSSSCLTFKTPATIGCSSQLIILWQVLSLAICSVFFCFVFTDLFYFIMPQTVWQMLQWAVLPLAHIWNLQFIFYVLLDFCVCLSLCVHFFSIWYDVYCHCFCFVFLSCHQCTQHQWWFRSYRTDMRHIQATV